VSICLSKIYSVKAGLGNQFLDILVSFWELCAPKFASIAGLVDLRLFPRISYLKAEISWLRIFQLAEI